MVKQVVDTTLVRLLAEERHAADIVKILEGPNDCVIQHVEPFLLEAGLYQVLASVLLKRGEVSKTLDIRCQCAARSSSQLSRCSALTIPPFAGLSTGSSSTRRTLEEFSKYSISCGSRRTSPSSRNTDDGCSNAIGRLALRFASFPFLPTSPVSKTNFLFDSSSRTRSRHSRSTRVTCSTRSARRIPTRLISSWRTPSCKNEVPSVESSFQFDVCLTPLYLTGRWVVCGPREALHRPTRRAPRGPGDEGASSGSRSVLSVTKRVPAIT